MLVRGFSHTLMRRKIASYASAIRNNCREGCLSSTTSLYFVAHSWLISIKIAFLTPRTLSAAHTICSTTYGTIEIVS